MSESTHLKCPCQHCGSSIEFPAHGIGLSIDCPHCSGKTVLFLSPSGAPETESNDSDSDESALEAEAGSSPEAAVEPGGWRRSRAWLIVTGIIVAAGIGGFMAFRKKSTESEAPAASDVPSSASVSAVSPASTSPLPETNVAPVKATKSVDDLKVGPIKLEKAKGSSLVYAVGVMRNASDIQRFGVNIEVELTDTGGKKVGIAKDYRNVLEPRQEWRFRALVLDSKAVSASVAQIREEE